jgi:glycerol-3-phosphate acyltransferase PlsY
MWLAYIITLFACYLLGSIPVGVIVGRGQGIDIREFGSGNIGATNVYRTLGKKAAAIVFLGDTLKGTLAVGLCMLMASQTHPPVEGDLLYLFKVLGAAWAVIGHNWSVFLGFEGGKGVATTLGTTVLIDWRVALVAFLVWLVVLLATRYMSVASMSAAVAAPFLAWLFPGVPPAYRIFFIVAAAFVVARHHSNVQRLLSGTENRFGTKVPVPAGTAGGPEGEPAGASEASSREADE